jgi:hypothetical protein
MGQGGHFRFGQESCIGVIQRIEHPRNGAFEKHISFDFPYIVPLDKIKYVSDKREVLFCRSAVGPYLCLCRRR